MRVAGGGGGGQGCGLRFRVQVLGFVVEVCDQGLGFRV